VRKETIFKPIIHTEKDNFINMLQSELACTILALSSYDPYNEEESREARLEYKSYLNIRMVLSELTDDIRSWDTQYYGNAKRYSCDYISEAFKILKTSKRRVLNVLGDTCGKCGASGKVEIHHIVPISKDGSAEIENLMVLCHGCHKEAHKYDVHSNTTPTKKFSASFTIGNFVRVEQEA
jgi:5-methylcytosine-specific restriction endonuclease McrA